MGSGGGWAGLVGCLPTLGRPAGAGNGRRVVGSRGIPRSLGLEGGRFSSVEKPIQNINNVYFGSSFATSKNFGTSTEELLR